MLILAATPSGASSRPREKPIITRSRPDFYVKMLQTAPPALADVPAPSSRKLKKAAEILPREDVLAWEGAALLGAFSFPINSKPTGAASRAADPITLKPTGAAPDGEICIFENPIEEGERAGKAHFTTDGASFTIPTVHSKIEAGETVIKIECCKTERGATAAVAWHAEPDHALTDELYKADKPPAYPPANDLSTDLPSPFHFPFISGQSSSAPGRTRQRGQFWAALLLGAFGVFLSEWMWPSRFAAALVRWSNSGGRLVRCRTGSRRGTWLILVCGVAYEASTARYTRGRGAMSGLLSINSIVPESCPADSAGKARRLVETHSFEQGSYCEPGAAPLPCEQGSYSREQPTSQGSNQPHSGEQGSYSRATNLAASKECTLCDEGHACTTGSVTPTPCSPGSNASGLGNARCELCAYQSATGATSCSLPATQPAASAFSVASAASSLVSGCLPLIVPALVIGCGASWPVQSGVEAVYLAAAAACLPGAAAAPVESSASSITLSYFTEGGAMPLSFLFAVGVFAATAELVLRQLRWRRNSTAAFSPPVFSPPPSPPESPSRAIWKHALVCYADSFAFLATLQLDMSGLQLLLHSVMGYLWKVFHLLGKLRADPLAPVMEVVEAVANMSRYLDIDPYYFVEHSAALDVLNVALGLLKLLATYGRKAFLFCDVLGLFTNADEEDDDGVVQVHECVADPKKAQAEADVELLTHPRDYSDDKSSLDLSNARLADGDAATIAVWLKGNAVLTELNLSGSPPGGGGIGDEGAKALASALRVNGVLKNIDLRGNSLGTEGWCAIFAALRDNKENKIESWDLSSQGINTEIAKVLAEYVSVSGVLTKLNLDGHELDLPKLRGTNPVTSLHLSRESLGSASAIVIASLIAGNGVLKNLNLYFNNIGDTGAIAIAEALRGNGVLKSIDVRRNKISGDTAQPLATAVLASPSLEIFGSVPLKELRANTLHKLDLSGEGLGVPEALVLAKLVEGSELLTNLVLYNNNVGDEGAAALVSALRVNGVLKIIDLRYNSLGDEGKGVIRDAVSGREGFELKV